ncbi:hypothetical protein JYT99_03065 [bacterium AH-315-E09]|nr:hypothetical protein [bacterium AH-315-E09]
METYIIYFMTAYIVNIIITSAVHFTSFYIVTGARADVVFTKFFILPTTFKKFISYLLSVDYWSAASFKTNIAASDKKCLASFMKKSNWINFILSTVVFISLITILCFSGQKNLPDLYVLVKLIWVIRTISRSFEIIIAFGKDVIDDEVKKSDLKPGDRIKLAIISNFETTLNYAVIYSIYQFSFSEVSCVNANCQEVICQPDTFSGYFFSSLGVSTFTNVSFSSCNTMLQNLFISLHLITAMSLIFFAIAKYISDKK